MLYINIISGGVHAHFSASTKAKLCNGLEALSIYYACILFGVVQERHPHTGVVFSPRIGDFRWHSSEYLYVTTLYVLHNLEAALTVQSVMTQYASLEDKAMGVCTEYCTAYRLLRSDSTNLRQGGTKSFRESGFAF